MYADRPTPTRPHLLRVLVLVGVACAEDNAGGSADTTTPPSGGPPALCTTAGGAEVEALEVVPAAAPTLVQSLVADVTGPGPIAVACVNDADPTEVHLVEASGIDDLQVDIAGLLPEASYTCTAAPLCGQAEGRRPVQARFATGSLPDGLPEVVVEGDPTALEGGAYVITNHQDLCSTEKSTRLVVYDEEGRVRWVTTLPEDLDLAVEGTYLGGGEFFWGGGRQTYANPHILDAHGNTLYEARFPGSDQLVFAHEAQVVQTEDMTRRALLALHYTEDVGPEGMTWQGFGLTLSDEADNLLWSYTSQEGFDEGLLPKGAPGLDTYHANAATLAEVDGRLVAYVSLLRQGWVVAIDTTDNHILWRLGRNGDFTLYDTAGAPLAEDAFSQAQHAVQVEGGRVLMYDNGDVRHQSRAVVYSLDEAAGTATLEASWEESPWFEPSLGSVEWLPGGHILVDEAHSYLQSGFPDDLNTIVEVDLATGEPVWRLTMGSRCDSTYRAHRVDLCDLFADTAHCPDVAARFEEIRGRLGL